MTPKISIIIPTHNRKAALLSTLGALAHQNVPPDWYEVIVVADGCQDMTAAAVASLAVPYRLTCIEQSASGASAARNRGVEAASAPLLLFLDDDMEASEGLIAAHLAAHAGQLGEVILGYFPVKERPGVTDIFEQSSNLWWQSLLNRQAQPSHRFTFQDLCAGNFSLPRQLFDSVGGFDIRYHGKAGEDNELGVRLLKRGAHFYFAQDAMSIHHDVPSQERSFKRATADGYGHVLMVQKHPELFYMLPLGWPISGKLPRLLWKLAWHRPQLGEWIAKLLERPLNISRAYKLRSKWKKIYGALHSYYYWRGVRGALGSLSELRLLEQKVPNEQAFYNEIELDLTTDLPNLEHILKEQRVDAIRIRYGSTPLGRIGPIPGAEGLRGVHVRHELIHRFGSALLGTLVVDRLPGVLDGQAITPHASLKLQADTLAYIQVE